MKKINALVTSVGGIVAQGIIKSLKYHNKYQNDTGHRYEILGTDINYEAAGLYRVHKFSLVTKPSDRNYLKTILELCNKNKIHVLFIGSDVELPILCKYREKIENITGAKVITSRENVVELCRDKYLTYQFLEKNNLNAIPTCLPDGLDWFLKEEKFPLVVKPREGFGSKLFHLVSNHDELDFAIRSIENANWKPMIQKYLKNDLKEYTTGITIDKDGRQVMSSITMRKVLKHGQTYKAFIDYFPQVKKICNRIASSLDTEGPINIQSRLDTDDKKVKIIEINSRFSASCPMRTVAGINEPDIITRNVLFNEKIKIEKYRPLICMRYWNETYVDKEKLDKVKSKKSNINKLNSEIFDYF